jgi:hypothetical protein
MESLEFGWLFLITTAPGAGWLLAVGGSVDEMLSGSRLVGAQIAELRPEAGRFPVSPAIAEPLAGEGWLACGTAAMAFDPICGDGTAHAVREAILAAAVIRAALAGGDGPSLAQHYQARLTAGFRRHLEHCLGFYESGGKGEWWQREAAAVRAGISFCEKRLRDFGPPRYRLQGFDLQSV